MDARGKLKTVLEKTWPYFLLFLFCLYFCHRFYGVFLPFDPNVVQNVYYLFHKSLIEADHNPYHWYYSSYLPISNVYNPVTLMAGAGIEILAQTSTPVAQALFTNMLTSAICLWFFSCSVFFFLRYLGRNTLGSLMGATVASFTGFHITTGVRMFDQYYLLSFLAVVPTLLCFEKIAKEQDKGQWVAAAALCIGVSLLGGTNTPLFYYIPVALLLPWLTSKCQKKWRAFVFLLAAVSMGILASSALLIPGLAYLKETNRSQLLFSPPGLFHPNPMEWLLAAVFRDWWVSRKIPYETLDHFMGLPALWLAVLGAWRLREEIKRKSDSKGLILLLCLCGLIAAIVLNYAWLPGIFQSALSFFFEAMSMREPHRLFLLALLPIAYLVALGTETSWNQKKVSFTLFIVAVFFFCGAYFVLPNWARLLPEQRIACVLSQVCGFSTMALMLFTSSHPWMLRRTAITSTLFFATYAFAPIQLTSFSSFYFEEREHLENIFPDRLSFNSLLGLKWNYSLAVRDVTAILTEPPPTLRDPKTRTGRIWEGLPFNKRTLSYFAPETGHHFTFTNVDDPAGPKRMRDLVVNRTEPLLDLAGICWKGEGLLSWSGKVPWSYRPSCFNEAFVVPKIKRFNDRVALIEWLKNASRKELLKFACLNCAEEDCSTLPEIGEGDINEREVTVIRSSPGRLTYKVKGGKKAFLVITTPYRFDWKATISGVPAKLLRADHAFMGVEIGPDESVVDLNLNLYIRTYSEIISMAAVLFIVCFWLIKRRSANRISLSQEAGL